MKRISSDINKFRYELTAFLNASRSVTQIMQKEFSNKQGFDDWYSQKQGEMQRNGTLKYLHRQRSISFHEHPILFYPIQVTSQTTESARMRVALTGTSSSINLSSGFVVAPIVKTVMSIKYYFDDIPTEEKDVITICQEAVNALEPIVDECEKSFATE